MSSRRRNDQPVFVSDGKCRMCAPRLRTLVLCPTRSVRSVWFPSRWDCEDLHPMHRLIVVGDGPGRAELEYRCDQAVFMGTLTQSETSEVLASADLFVCPSETCSTSHGVLEAQASGLPALVMERGSARERVSRNSGCICRSTVDLIVETAALIRNTDRRKVMSRAAREHGLQAGLESAVAPFYAEFRAAAARSGVRRELRPAFVSQGRRL